MFSDHFLGTSCFVLSNCKTLQAPTSHCVVSWPHESWTGRPRGDDNERGAKMVLSLRGQRSNWMPPSTLFTQNLFGRLPIQYGCRSKPSEYPLGMGTSHPTVVLSKSPRLQGLQGPWSPWSQPGCAHGLSCRPELEHWSTMKQKWLHKRRVKIYSFLVEVEKLK